MGRFTQSDPIAGILGLGRSYNAYGYAEQNPTSRVDPSGLLSNATIAASFGFESFEELVNQWPQLLSWGPSGPDWGFLKMLQDANVWDRIYGGGWDWTGLHGYLKCYDSSDPSDCFPLQYTPIDTNYDPPLEGGVVLCKSPAACETLLRELGGSSSLTWWYLNNNRPPWSAYTTKASGAFLPDYVVLDLGKDIPGLGIPGMGVGIEGTGIVDRYGNLYVGLGGDFGIDTGALLDFNIAGGYLNRLPGSSRIPEEGRLVETIQEWGGGVNLLFVFGLSYDYDFADFPVGFFRSLSFEGGVGTSLGSWTFVSYVWKLPFKWSYPWDYIDRYPMEHGYERQDIRMVDDRPSDCGC